MDDLYLLAYIDDFHNNYLRDYYDKHLFLETVHFRFSNNNITKHTINRYANRAFRSYRKHFIHIQKLLLGQRFNKKIESQSLSIAALDVAGTRKHKHNNGYSLPHIHALWLVPPDSLDQFNLYRKSPNMLKGHPEIDSVDFEPFDKQRKGIDSMCTYVMKFARKHLESNLIDRTYEIYPDTRNIFKTVFKHHDFYMDNLSTT